jgi:hypothetical protein
MISASIMFSSLLLVSALVSLTSGFSPTPFQSRVTSSLFQQETNWLEYRHEYVDPLTPHQVESKIHSHLDPKKRAVSDEYWLRQMEQEKEKLHNMMNEINNGDNEKNGVTPTFHLETFQHYKRENIDPMIHAHETPSAVKSHMDPIKRQNADKFWRAKLLDDKEKARRSASTSKGTSSEKETEFCQRELYQ